MAVIVRDKDLERQLEAESKRRSGGRGTKAGVLRDIAREHFLRLQLAREQEQPRRREKATA